MKIARACYYRSLPQLQCRNYISAKLAENPCQLFRICSHIKPKNIYSIKTCGNGAFPLIPITHTLYPL
jgi:hypothetical protein